MRLTCSCGQTLEIADEFAGRVAQCPACQKSFTVPAGPGPAAAAVAAAPAAAARGQQALLDRLPRLATASLACGIASLSLYVVVFVVLAIIGQGQQSGRIAQSDPPLVPSIAAILLSLVAVTLSVVAIACGVKGKKPENTRNRGTGLAGFILGIVGACCSACCLSLFGIGFVIGLATAVKGM